MSTEPVIPVAGQLWSITDDGVKRYQVHFRPVGVTEVDLEEQMVYVENHQSDWGKGLSMHNGIRMTDFLKFFTRPSN